MPTARKLPSGSWRCRVYTHSEAGVKKYKSFTADTKREAELLALNYEYKESPKVMSFKLRMKEYLENKSNILSPSTLRSYKSMQTKLNDDYKWFVEKEKIKEADVQKLINDLSADCSPKTCKNYNGFISAVLGSNTGFKIKLPQTVKPIYKIPSTEQIQALFKDIEGKEIEVPILLGATCMMRRGEIAALTLDDIEGNIIHISKDKVRGDDKKWHEKTTKTVSSDRYIQAPDFVIDKIKKKGYVTNLTPDAISQRFNRIVKRLDMEGTRFHDLRHFGASYRHNVLNIPDAIVQADGGWASDATLKNIYRHAMDEERLRYSGIVNSSFSTMYDTKYDTKPN